MEQKPSHIFSLIILFCIIFLSCEKLEIPDNSKIEVKDSISSEENMDVQALSVLETISAYNETKTKISNKYVVGYIVGYINGNSIKSTEFVAGDSKTNIVIADTPVEKDYTNCIPVQLTTENQDCSKVRNALNLSANPHMLGKKIRIKGDIDIYMNSVGIKKTRECIILFDDFDYDAWNKEQENKQDSTNNSNNDDNEDSLPIDTIVPLDPIEDPNNNNNNDQTYENVAKYLMTHGTDFTNPYKVSDMTNGAIKQYQDSIMFDYISGCYVKGYIVGYVKGNKIETAVFDIGNLASNILLADNPNETDCNNCIAVQLPTSPTSCKKTRTALNLYENPTNLGKAVIIRGTIQKYMGKLGLKEANDYKFIE